ncbi:MAG: hypothetical protein LUC43_09465 [Burkholderiales bacterium]|nr:hypothetical protein [Burkholderiales bacterium]
MQKARPPVIFVSYRFSLPSGTIQETVTDADPVYDENGFPLPRIHIRQKTIPTSALTALEYGREVLLKKLRSRGQEFANGFVFEECQQSWVVERLEECELMYEQLKRDLELLYLRIKSDDQERTRLLGPNSVSATKIPPLEDILPWFKFEYCVLPMEADQKLENALVRNHSLQAIDVLTKYAKSGFSFKGDNYTAALDIVSNLSRWHEFLSAELQGLFKRFRPSMTALNMSVANQQSDKELVNLLISVARKHTSFPRTEVANLLGVGEKLPAQKPILPLVPDNSGSLYLPGLDESCKVPVIDKEEKLTK